MSPRWLVVSILALARCGGPAFDEGATAAADRGAVDAQADDGEAGPSVLAADVEAGARSPVDAGGDVGEREAGPVASGDGGSCMSGYECGASCPPSPWKACPTNLCAAGQACCMLCP